MRSSSISTLALMLALPSGTALAQGMTQLHEVVLSAGFAPVEEARHGRAATVLDGADLQARGITTVQDALRAVPGVSVSSSGASNTSVRLRGGEANHVLFLMDGVRIPGSMDTYYLSGLPVGDIERIEILRGPQTVTFGSNAASGVINVISKAADGNGHGAALELGNGHVAEAWVQRRGEKGGLRLSLGQVDDHGYDYSGRGGEKDFTRRNTARLNGDWQATDALRFTAHLFASSEKFAWDEVNYGATSAADYLDDSRDVVSWRRETAFNLGLSHAEAGARLSHQLDLSLSEFATRNDPDEAWDRSWQQGLKYRLGVGLDGAIDTARQRLFVMAATQRDGNSVQSDYDRRQQSLAVEYRGDFDNGLSLQGGLRRDRNSRFDDFTGWNLAVSWQVDPQWRLHGSAGRASVDPNYSEIYGRPDWYTLPNHALSPERNDSVDLGVEFTSADGAFKGDVTLFHERLNNEIVNVYDPTTWESINVNKPGTAHRKGAELAATWAASAALSFRLDYTYLDARRADGTVAVRRPRHELGLGAQWQGEQWHLAGDVRHVAGNYDNQWWTGGSTTAVKMPEWTTLNLAAGYRVNDNVELTLRVTNVFDVATSDVWGYPNQGRAVWAGIRTRF